MSEKKLWVYSCTYLICLGQSAMYHASNKKLNESGQLLCSQQNWLHRLSHLYVTSLTSIMWRASKLTRTRIQTPHASLSKQYQCSLYLSMCKSYYNKCKRIRNDKEWWDSLFTTWEPKFPQKSYSINLIIIYYPQKFS